MLQRALDRELEAQRLSRQAEALARDAKHEIVLGHLASFDFGVTAQLDTLQELVEDRLGALTERVEAALLHERDTAAAHRAELTQSLAAVTATVERLTAFFTAPPAATDPTIETMEEMLARAQSQPEMKKALATLLAEAEFDTPEIEFH